MGIETGSTRSHPVESSLWKRLWTCKADFGMMNVMRRDASDVHIQGVPGGMCQTSGGCSLC